MSNQSFFSRRAFLKVSAAATAAAALAQPNLAFGQDADKIKVGLIGCGRRGTDAAKNCIGSAPNVELVALGDVFQERADACRTHLATDLGDKCKVTKETSFAGFDAYQKVLAADVNLVILTTPPGFRPQHLAAAVEAGKNVFMEKPAAVDPVGIRSIIASAGKAKEKHLAIVAGTQRRHQACYVELLKRVHDGAIGDLVGGGAYWIGDYSYYAPVYKKPEWSDMEWQLRNWNYFVWLSGDHIVEQHVHNLDILNWAFKGHPLKALGMGGRQQRTDPVFGHIYDHFAVEFEFPGGVRVVSMCRQNENTSNRVSEHLVGTLGTCDPSNAIAGKNAYQFKGNQTNPYVQEHTDLIESIRNARPLNEGVQVAESTMTAILGRMSAYTGREINWDWAMNASKLTTFPDKLIMGKLPVPPVAVPGKMRLV